MDDLLLINQAKTEFRECFNLSDPSRLLAIADPELTSFPEGHPTEFGAYGLDALKSRLDNLFLRYKVQLAVIVIEIRIHGDIAYDFGWHVLTFTPKEGGQPIRRKDRYMDLWRRNEEGKWKLCMYMENLDVPEPFRLEQTSCNRI